MLHFSSDTIQERFLEAVASLNLLRPVTDIAEGTGATEGNISMFLNSRRLVSDNFLKKFCEVYKFSYEEITQKGGVRLPRGSVKKDSAEGEVKNIFTTDDANKPVTTGEVASMYIELSEKLNQIALSLNSGLQIGKVNNSLIQTVLLKSAEREAGSNQDGQKDVTVGNIFAASLNVAQKILEGTFGK